MEAIMNMKKMTFQGLRNALLPMFLVVLMLSSGLQAEESRSATIASIIGSVKIQKSGVPRWFPAKVGMKLAQSDKIRTELGASCRIELAKGTFVKLEPNTIISLSTLTQQGGANKTDVKVWSGDMFAKVNKLKSGNETFMLSTPSIVAGVRGTRLSANVNNGVGAIASDPENEPGSIVVFTPGNRGKSKDLTPGKKVVGKTDGSLSDEQDLSREEAALININKEEEEAIETGQPPVLEIKNLKEQKIIFDGILDVHGRSEAEAEIRLLINDSFLESQILDKKEFRFKNIDISEYMNSSVTISLIAINQFGQQSFASHSVEIKPRPVSLELTGPANGSEVSEDTILFSGTTDPGAQITISIAGNELASVDASAQGKFSASVDVASLRTESIQSGQPEQSFQLTASREGESAIIEGSLRFVQLPLDVSLIEPAGDIVVQKAELAVKANTGNPANISIILNGAEVISGETGEDGNFESSLDLSEYFNEAPVQAGFVFTDKVSGESVTINRLIQYRIEPEIVAFEIVTPLVNNTYATVSEIVIKGQFQPAFMSTLSINGAEVSHSEGRFETILSLEEGEQEIVAELQVKDESVNLSRSFIVDTIAPDIADISVEDPLSQSLGAPLNVLLSELVTVRAIVTGEASEVKIANQAALESGAEAYEIGMVNRQDGNKSFEVVAIDEAGNVSRRTSEEFIVDRTQPFVKVENVSLPEIMISTKPDTMIFVEVNGSPFIDAERASANRVLINLTDVLEEGENQISIQSKDDYGRESQVVTRKLLFDQTPPVLVSSSLTVLNTSVEVEMQWSEPVKVRYYPGGKSVNFYRDINSDSSGLITFKVSGSDMPTTLRVKEIDGNILQVVQATDDSGNISEWYGSDSDVGVISTERPPDPPSRN